VTFNLAETSVVKSRPSVAHGANLFGSLQTCGAWMCHGGRSK